jgi:hypothetical protein
VPKVVVANSLRRFVACPDEVVVGATVAAALTAYFERHPKVRGYVLDDQGALRHHVALFVAGEPLADRRTLSDAVAEAAEIHIIQALSGG